MYFLYWFGVIFQFSFFFFILRPFVHYTSKSPRPNDHVHLSLETRTIRVQYLYFSLLERLRTSLSMYVYVCACECLRDCVCVSDKVSAASVCRSTGLFSLVVHHALTRSSIIRWSIFIAYLTRVSTHTHVHTPAGDTVSQFVRVQKDEKRNASCGNR